MADYTAIADTSETIIELLRKNLVPEPIKNPQDIGLCRPDDRGNYVLGLQLYHIEENQEVKNQNKEYLDQEHYINPPTSLNLYYMLFVKSQAELSRKAIDEQRILGKAIQVLDDNSRIEAEDLKGSLMESNAVIDVQNLVMPFADAASIYNMFDRTFILSAFYKVSPVFIDMEKVRTVKRVTSAQIFVNSKGIK